MRVYMFAAGLALSVIASASGKGIETGADAQRYCQPLVGGSFRDTDEARSAGACEGMVETTLAFSPSLPADSRACPPAQGSALEGVKILLWYLEKNPERLSEPAITLAIAAFRDAWPCDGADAGVPGGASAKHRKRAPKKPKQQGE